MPILKIVIPALLGFPLFAHAAAGPWALVSDRSLPTVRFAASEIRSSCISHGVQLIEEPLEGLARATAERRIVIAAGAAAGRVASALGAKPPAQSFPQSYAIRRVSLNGHTTVAVLGADPEGAMYGGLDVAEAIRLGDLDAIADADHSPHIAERGLKLNIPLDVRTPSYSDNSTSAQNNIPEMWSFDFWREFLDDMARHRYNVLSLWSLGPFPSLVKVPEFPDVALEDVWRTRVPMDDTYSHGGQDMLRPQLLQNVEVVRKMTIDQKIGFWRDVMQYAHDRGIAVYWFTWNLFTFGAEPRYGITADQSNPKTIEYLRASVREMVLTYPLLAGFGITAGENMNGRIKGEFSNEKFLWKTYGLGVADALKLQPNREVRMIHRYHMASHDEIVREWKDYPGPFDLSFKYSVAHMYSIPNPPFINEALPYLSPKLRTWLTLRDDDYYSFRWGDPEYARAYVRNMPGPDKIAGFYMGADGYTWGREFLSKEPDTPRQLIIDRRWYAFMIWGRLSYDPTLPDDHFRRVLAAHFPQTDSGLLFRAWSQASKIFPQITRFFWGDIDLRWLPEACLSHPRYKGFYTVKDFMEGGTMPGSGILNVVEWRARKLAGQAIDSGPLEVADALAAAASDTLMALPALRRNESGNKELRSTLGDLQAMAHLGNYYAEKIRAATDLALFDKTRDDKQRESAVRHLGQALEHWKRYAAAYALQYQQPRLYNRVGWIDLNALTPKVERDIAIARLWSPGTIPDQTGARPADTPFRK